MLHVIVGTLVKVWDAKKKLTIAMNGSNPGTRELLTICAECEMNHEVMVELHLFHKNIAPAPTLIQEHILLG